MTFYAFCEHFLYIEICLLCSIIKTLCKRKCEVLSLREIEITNLVCCSENALPY